MQNSFDAAEARRKLREGCAPAPASPKHKHYWSAEAVKLEIGDVIFQAVADGRVSGPQGVVLRVLLNRRFDATVVDLTPDDGDDEPILLTLAPGGAA